MAKPFIVCRYCTDTVVLYRHSTHADPKRTEFILEGNLLEKSVLHIFALYNLLGPETSFYRKSKINIIRKPNYKIGWFHN